MKRADHFTALAHGQHRDPFAILGLHRSPKSFAVRAFAPHAATMQVVSLDGALRAEMKRVHPAGVFEARLDGDDHAYRLRVVHRDGTDVVFDDPYRFPPLLGEFDRHLIGEGRHERLYEVLGANRRQVDGVDGVLFAVWAPNAARVSVVGVFNDWDGRRHPLRRHALAGLWEIFIPGLGPGTLYKFELLGPDGQLLPLKADPLARRMEPAPGNASIVHEDAYRWGDADWMAGRARACALDRPMAIYEVHLGSWRRRHLEANRWLTYVELADELVSYVRDMGFTHIELLPVTEHPFDGSWGYQPLGMFAPTWRHGPPEGFKQLVDACHRAGIGVIVDWVPAHFPRDDYGLARFDGTALYEHPDTRRGAHQDWGTLIYDFGRLEVANFLVASALLWCEVYHVDALRVDAVASMLYLDYSREHGEWAPNVHGGNENLEAIAFMRRLNEAVHATGAVTMAEESTAWPLVSRPTYAGGLGYSYKWNMGWMNDTLSYMSEDPVHRTYHHDKLTFGLVYAFTENFILPLSHDEVVHGKRSVLRKMPGDAWRRFANMRAYLGFMYAYPGKKLLFMGIEFAQEREWNYDAALDWHLLDRPAHAGAQHLVRDLNWLHRRYPALHEGDHSSGGFEWIDCHDRDRSVIAFARRASDREDAVVVLCNFTPVPRVDYRVGVERSGNYREILNTDAAEYGGSGMGNPGSLASEPVPMHFRNESLLLTVPPLATLILKLDDRGHDDC